MTSPEFGETVKIFVVLPQLKILPSKQKPRFLEILGSDGSIYQYLLKGREDLRQDQRATQVIRFLDELVSAGKTKKMEPFRFLSPFSPLKTASEKNELTATGEIRGINRTIGQSFPLKSMITYQCWFYRSLKDYRVPR